MILKIDCGSEFGRRTAYYRVRSDGQTESNPLFVSEDEGLTWNNEVKNFGSMKLSEVSKKINNLRERREDYRNSQSMRDHKTEWTIYFRLKKLEDVGKEIRRELKEKIERRKEQENMYPSVQQE